MRFSKRFCTKTRMNAALLIFICIPAAAQAPDLRLLYDCKTQSVTFVAYAAGSYVLKFADIALACARSAA